MKKGYSLLEAVIYSAILAVIVSISAVSIISSWRGFQKIKIDGQIAKNGEFVLELVTRDARLGENIGASSVFGVNPGILEIVSGATSTIYSISGTVLQRKVDNNSPENITSNDSKIKSLIFWKESHSTENVSSNIIKMEFIVESGEGVLLKQRKFFGSAVLRGSY